MKYFCTIASSCLTVDNIAGDSQPMSIHKSIWVPLVVGLEIILVTLYATTININRGEPLPFLDVNGARTLPSILQVTQLFLIGVLPLWMYFTYRDQQIPPSRNLLGCVALLFLYAATDELFKLSFIGNQHHLWKSVYLALGFSIPILFYRDLIRLFQQYPKPMRLIVIGFVTFLVGGFGLELFRSYIQEPYWYKLFGRWQFYQVDSVRTALEELGEMLGETIVLQGTLGIVAQRSRLVATAQRSHCQ